MSKDVLKQLFKEFGEPIEDKDSIPSIANIFYEIGTKQGQHKNKDVLERLLAE